MARQYYYLVAGLPNIIFDVNSKGFDHGKIKADIAESINKKDMPLWEAMYLPYDNENLLNYLLQNGKPFSELGKYSQEELEEEIFEPVTMPSYMVNFIQEYCTIKGNRHIETERTPLELENGMNEKFYEYVESLRNRFIKKWYSFDRWLRNLQVANISRKSKKDVNEYLIGGGDITDMLRKNTSSDFGIKGESEWLDKAMQILENTNVIEREWRLDELRWDAAEDFNAVEYFNIDKILEFAVKLQISDRWMILSKEKGEAKLKELIASIHETFNVEKTFELEENN